MHLVENWLSITYDLGTFFPKQIEAHDFDYCESRSFLNFWGYKCRGSNEADGLRFIMG